MQTAGLLKLIGDLFFPPVCVGCGKIGKFICTKCMQNLPLLLPPLCEKCGKPESTGLLCPTCWGWQANIDGIRSPYRFDGVIRDAIYEFKYKNIRSMAGFMADLLASYLINCPMPGDVLVSVPLSQQRLRTRGYNQSSILTRELSKLVRLPVVEDCLVRTRNSPPQARTTNVRERHRNVSGAFACRDDRLSGKRVILLDDVCTTGATLDACALALKNGNAISVWGITLARET
jgi:competence protein ComFC